MTKGTGTFRRAALERVALAAGEQWALSYRALVHEQGRAISGGWPGTMSEARARVTAAFLGGHKKSLSAISNAELDWLAKAAYGRARREWLAVAERDGP